MSISSVFVDFNLFFLWFGFSPSSQVQHLYYQTPRLADSVQQISLQKIIELTFCQSADSLDQESLFWFYVENNCLQVQEWFEEDSNLIFEVEHLLGKMTEYADELLRATLASVNLLTHYEGYVFECWVDSTTALFLHTSNDSEAYL